MIYIASKRRKITNIKRDYPFAKIIDVTSKSSESEMRKLSPFYPHMNIPIPLESNGLKASSVEAIWQGLKVFETSDIDTELFKNSSMTSIKRTVRKYGKPLGHRKGVYGTELLNYIDARKQIYLPAYKWVLDNIKEVHATILKIKELSSSKDVVLLDYNTNGDYCVTTSPLSHACLIKYYIENTYPCD